MPLGHFLRNACRKENKVRLWFEIDDTGCGIDPSKWESVFESFEQADPSTTRRHGGTGLGLCIVRTLVRKLGGEIKIVEKNGPGTLMRLCLLLGSSTESAGQQLRQLEFANYKLVVLLGLSGNTGRLIMSNWLYKRGVPTGQASDWNELTQLLRRIFQEKGSNEGDNVLSHTEFFNDNAFKDTGTSQFVIVVDIGLLDLSTNIWKEQLNCLNRYAGKAKFAWILKHDTSSSVKMELQRKGHLLMVNRPLYKSKMIQILEAVINERNSEQDKGSDSFSSSSTMLGGDAHECLEVEPIHYDGSSSDDSDKMDLRCSSSRSQAETNKTEKIGRPSFSHLTAVNNYLLEIDEDCPASNQKDRQKEHINSSSSMQVVSRNCPEDRNNLHFAKNMSEQKSLEGLKILLAEDTPVLQRVATIMLEKVGAKVMAVGDGLQAVNALKCSLNVEGCYVGSPLKDGMTIQAQGLTRNFTLFDLVLMDCQMPKMDGYEATKEIRRNEVGSGTHIPIVALTAHAMSSDEAKCLEVGMDAYLTKPIDYQLMVSTILSLTKKVS